MNTEIWDRLETLKTAREVAEKAETEWQTFLRSLVAKGEKGPFTNSQGNDKYLYPVKGGSLCLANKRTGPGKKKDKKTD